MKHQKLIFIQEKKINRAMLSERDENDYFSQFVEVVEYGHILNMVGRITTLQLCHTRSTTTCKVH